MPIYSIFRGSIYEKNGYIMLKTQKNIVKIIKTKNGDSKEKKFNSSLRVHPK